MKNPSDRYFAARPVDKIGESLANKLEEECGAADVTARAEVYATAYEHYYGFDTGRGPTYGVSRAGEQGELAEVRIAKASALLKSFLSLVIGQRVDWRPQAASGASNARRATILAASLLEDGWYQGKVEQVWHQKAEMALAWSEAFTLHLWDTTIGPIVGHDPETEMPLRGGDIRRVNLLPWDVVRESKARTYKDCKWKFCRVFENKWDVMAQHPVDVLDQPTRDTILAAARDDQMKLATPVLTEDTDIIPVWYFFHECTPTLPFGMEVKFISGKCVLRYRKLSYGKPDERRIPLCRFAFDELFNTPYAYSRWWDTLGPQELMDGIQTSIATNILTLGTQSIAFEQGTQVSEDAVKGMRSFEFPRGAAKPEGVNLVKVAPEAFTHLQNIARDQQQMLNLNDTFRGQPDTAQMNAQAFMILKTSASEQNSPVVTRAHDDLSDMGTLDLQIYAEYLSDERKVRITGTQQKYLYDEASYTGTDLSPIACVRVPVGNPIEKSAAGRFALAQVLQGMRHENGERVSVEEMVEVMDTGRIEPLIQPARDQQMLLNSENDKLSSGQQVQAHALDNHLVHGQHNLAPIMNSQGRADPAVNKATLDHVHQHYCLFFGLPVQPGQDAYQTALQDPEYFGRIRILLGQQPPAPEASMGPPPPGAQPAPGEVMAAPAGAPPPPVPAPQPGAPNVPPTFVQPGGDLPLM